MDMMVYEVGIDINIPLIGTEIKICPVRHTYILAYNSR